MQCFFMAEQPARLRAEPIGWHQLSPMAGEQAPRNIPAWDGLAARSRSSRRGSLPLVGAVFGALLVSVILVVSLTQASSPRRGPTARQLTMNQLQAGDCLVGANLGLGTDNPWPYTVTTVPCTQGHIAEVIFAGSPLPEAPATYPADTSVNGTCSRAFATYDGIDEWQSVFRVQDVGLGGEGNEAICVADLGGATLRHSIKGSRR